MKKLLFIMNQENERYRQDLYMSVGTMKDLKSEKSTHLKMFIMIQ
jgi:hypothetical protein